MQFLLVLDGFRAQNSSYAVNILESLINLISATL